MSRLTADPAHSRRLAAAHLRAVADELDRQKIATVTPAQLRTIASELERP